MSENNTSEVTIKETPPPARPREVIQKDLVGIEDAFTKLEEEMSPLRDKYDELPEDHQQLFDSFARKFEDKDVTDEEIEKDCPQELVPILKELRGYIGRGKNLYKRQDNLHEEELHYVKDESEKALQSLASRVDYDGVFAYFREIETRSKERIGGSDLLSNVATELYILRKYLHEQQNGLIDGVPDFYYYDSILRTVKQFDGEWSKRGFVREASSQDNTEVDYIPREKVVEARTQLVAESQKSLEQLEQYGEMFPTYRPSIRNNREHIDHWLEEVVRVLDFDPEKGRNLYYSESFAQIDFDPAFVLAAKRQIDQIVLEHRRAGRLPKTADVLQEDRQRIDAVSNEALFGGLKFEGFETPEGMTRLVSPEEIIEQAKKVIPPDFARNLRSLSHKPEAEKTDGSDPNVETVGTFIPVFGTGKDWDQLQVTEIEVYRDLFVAEGTDQIEAAVAKSEFMSTTWHEFGHNAHYTLDYDEMTTWEKIIKEDKTAITWYVRFSREKEEPRGKREDFAESFKLFLNNPALLFTLSPNRYHYMYEYFDRHLQTQQREPFKKKLREQLMISFAVWQKLGHSADDVRRIYLEIEDL